MSFGPGLFFMPGAAERCAAVWNRFIVPFVPPTHPKPHRNYAKEDRRTRQSSRRPWTIPSDKSLLWISSRTSRGELRYREYEKEYGTKKAPAAVKHRVAEIHVNRILKLDRAEKQDEPAPEVDPSELPADEPTS